MKVPQDPNLPAIGSRNFIDQLRYQVERMLRTTATQLNSLTEGRIGAVHNTVTAAPTTGTFSQGDFLKHSAPTEQGTAGSKYVIIGYVCVSAGTPGTWVEARFLTGN
jgi:hypothetical protein